MQLKSEKNCDLYNEAISILTSQRKFHINLGLERISKVLELAGNPQDCLKVIHIAGTNGKGSTCAMLASILTEAGYKMGLYTSPHLIEYTERIKINGQEISKEEFTRLVFEVISLSEKHNIPITEFEVLTAVAFIYFKKQKVDFVVLETGLGGRLDATNVVKIPVLSIITTIDYDHIDRLGNTIEQIAFEKAGIIKENIPVITLKENKGLNILEKIALESKSTLILANATEYKLEKYKVLEKNDEYNLPLLGLWQIKNLSLVIESIKFLNQIGISINQDAVKTGLKKVTWPGRMQYIKDKNIVLDGAHNLSAAKLLRESLDFYFPDKKIIWIYSSLNTKDYESIINVLFRNNDIVICTKSSSLSAVEPLMLQNTILSTTLVDKIHISDCVTEALSLSHSFVKNDYAEKDYLIVVAGSLYTVGDVLAILKKNCQF